MGSYKCLVNVMVKKLLSVKAFCSLCIVGIWRKMQSILSPRLQIMMGTSNNSCHIMQCFVSRSTHRAKLE